MPTYVLRNLPIDLWTKVRARADADRWPLRALVLRLFEDYAAGRITPSGTPPAMATDTHFDEGNRP